MKNLPLPTLACVFIASWASAANPPSPLPLHGSLLDSDPQGGSDGSNSGINMSATTNWAGATIDMPHGNESNTPAIGSVKSQWNIPRLCLGEGQNTSSARTLQTWIGISGKLCEPEGALVQAGVEAILQDDGNTSASAWASWYPAIPRMDIVDFEVEPGDVVTVEVLLENTTNGVVSMSNKRTNKLVAQDIFSPDPSVGDFSVCGDGDGRAWAVVEGAFTWEDAPPDTVTGVDGIPVFEDVSFRTLEVNALGRIEARDLHDDSAMLYVIADDQGLVVNVDTLGDQGFQLYMSESCGSSPE
ncbi:peptidase A4 family-domain-containing protein [Xylariaceae sp. FL1651]|nr:peptidase A4 family-domain-containing protein [Xylariaceae sp. FL1651]